MACNVPVETVWPTSSTLSTSTTTTSRATTTTTTPMSTRVAQYITQSNSWRRQSENMYNQKAPRNTPTPPAGSEKKQDLLASNNNHDDFAYGGDVGSNNNSPVYPEENSKNRQLSQTEQENKKAQGSSDGTNLTPRGGTLENQGNVALADESAYLTTTSLKHLTKNKTSSSSSSNFKQCSNGKY